jgi:outer membrane phospholipase A
MKKLPFRPLVSQDYAKGLVAFAALLGAADASAGISYQLTQAQATAGDTIRIKEVLFNDTDNAINQDIPRQRVLQWRNEQGRAVRSLAYRESPAGQVAVPVNNFVQVMWRAIVPKGVKGLQAVNIEGDATMMALDANPQGKARVAEAAAAVPVVDAGAAKEYQETDPPLPDNIVAATGASITQGPAINASNPVPIAPPSAFENFRTAISPYEPVYFDFGTKDGANARFQLSFKYRLFTPDDPANPAFIDNLYLGYTQTALWDLAGASKPFVDTTYNPSIFWHKDKIWQTSDQKWFAGLTSGIEHRSNGKGGEDSRSLNDAFIQPEVNYRFDGGSTLTFSPRVKAYVGISQNPDYPDYMGRVDWKLRWEQDNGLVLAGLYQQGHHGNHATQLEAAWPLQRTFLHMNGYVHLQYYDGYGETLLGYNQKSDPQVRIGLSLVP